MFLYINYSHTIVLGEILYMKSVFWKFLPLPLTCHMPLNVNY